MTMRNQLRAAFYLLSRSACIKLAFVVLAIAGTWRMFVAYTGAFELTVTLDSFASSWAPAICLLAATYPIFAEERSHGIRSALCSEHGRARYAVSRQLTVASCVMLLMGVALVFRLITWGKLGLVSRDASSEGGALGEAMRLVSLLLVVVAWANLGLLACWASRRWGVAAVLMVLALSGLSWFIVLTINSYLYLSIPDGFLLHSSWRAIAEGSSDPVALVFVPLVWIAIESALAQWLWARKAA